MRNFIKVDGEKNKFEAGCLSLGSVDDYKRQKLKLAPGGKEFRDRRLLSPLLKASDRASLPNGAYDFLA